MQSKVLLIAAVFGFVAISSVSSFYIRNPNVLRLLINWAAHPPQRPPTVILPPIRLPPPPPSPRRRVYTTPAPQEREEPPPPPEPVQVDPYVCYSEECDSNDRAADWKCANFCYENKCTLLPPSPFYRQGSCSDRYCDCF